MIIKLLNNTDKIPLVADFFQQDDVNLNMNFL